MEQNNYSADNQNEHGGMLHSPYAIGLSNYSLYVERNLVRIEDKVHTAYRGSMDLSCFDCFGSTHLM